jgi:hypothetical protein
MTLTLFGTVFVPLLFGILLFARAWLPALMVVAVVLQAASVVNVDLALWLGPGAGLGVYGITPYNAVAFCMGMLLLGRLVTVGVAVPVQVRGAAAWFVAYAVVAAFGAVVLPRVFAGTPVHDMLALYGMSQPPVPVQWSLSNLVQAVNMGVHAVVLLYVLQCAQQEPGFGRRMVVGVMTALLLVLLVGSYERLAWLMAWPSAKAFWLNNPGYALLGGQLSMRDILRVASPFSEPSYTSAFLATTTLGLMAVAAFGQRTRWALGLGVLSALGLFNTLSSTGWSAAGLAALAMVFWMGARASVLDEDNHIRAREAWIWLVLSAVLVATLWAAQSTRYSQDIDKTLNELLLNKSQPGNHEEREKTNVRALEIVQETQGLGVGMGSHRASSFMASLVSNTGVLGALLFCSMLGSLLWRYFKTPMLTDIQLFVGVSLATATLAMSLGIPDLNLPMYWGFIFLAFVFCPEPIKSGSDPN